MSKKNTPELRIGKRVVSPDQPTYFIADIAANHDGSLPRAIELIKLASAAGADCVKFQHFRAKHIVSGRGFEDLGGKFDHQSKWEKSVFEVYKEASLDWNWTQVLKAEADKAGVEFMTSPYDFEAVDHVDPFVNAFKIGSGDITWLEIIGHIASKNKPVILATGASSLQDVETAVAVIRSEGVPFSILQCNTNYTGDDSNVSHSNLKVIDSYLELFPDAVVGLSDHTPGDVTVLGAIAKGARIIEKHFTDDNSRSGPDHLFSMNPQSWREMVERSRLLESALGDGFKKVEENELKTVIVQRRSVRFNQRLHSGHVVTRDDLRIVRPAPADSFSPGSVDSIIGRRLIVDVDADQAVSESNFAN